LPQKRRNAIAKLIDNQEAEQSALAVIGENVEIAGAGNHRMIFGAKGGA